MQSAFKFLRYLEPTLRPYLHLLVEARMANVPPAGKNRYNLRGRLTIPSTGFTESGANWILSLQNTDVMGMNCYKGSDINLNSVD
ncbi:hypothetical protein J6590_073082 [Homalodisca vitripennis]|nr:hypothetical protein J6590_073082 [Homalodisca vitripennis]